VQKRELFIDNFELVLRLLQLCPTRGPPAACGPVEGFVRPSLDFRCSKSILYTENLSYFDNLQFVVFYAGGPQCHFITYVTIAFMIQMLSVHWAWLKLNLVCKDQISHSMCGPL